MAEAGDVIALLLDNQLVVSATLAVATALVGSYWYTGSPPAATAAGASDVRHQPPGHALQNDSNDAGCMPLTWQVEDELLRQSRAASHYGASTCSADAHAAMRQLSAPGGSSARPPVHSISVDSCLDTLFVTPAETPRQLTGNAPLGRSAWGGDVPAHRLSLDTASTRQSMEARFSPAPESHEQRLMRALCALSPTLMTHRLSIDDAHLLLDHEGDSLPFNPLRQRSRKRGGRQRQKARARASQRSAAAKPAAPPACFDGSAHSESSARLHGAFARPVSLSADGSLRPTADVGASTTSSSPGALATPKADAVERADSGRLSEWLFGGAAAAQQGDPATAVQPRVLARSQSLDQAPLQAALDRAPADEPPPPPRSVGSATAPASPAAQTWGRPARSAAPTLPRITSGQDLDECAGTQGRLLRDVPDSYAVSVSDRDALDSPGVPIGARHRGRMTFDVDAASFRMRALNTARAPSSSLDLPHSSSAPVLAIAPASARADDARQHTLPANALPAPRDASPVPRSTSPSITSAFASFFWPSRGVPEAPLSATSSPLKIVDASTASTSGRSSPHDDNSPRASPPTALTALLRHVSTQGQRPAAPPQAPPPAPAPSTLSSFLWSTPAAPPAPPPPPPAAEPPGLRSHHLVDIVPEEPASPAPAAPQPRAIAAAAPPPSPAPSQRAPAPPAPPPRATMVDTGHGPAVGCVLDVEDAPGTSPAVLDLVPDRFLIELGAVVGEAAAEARLVADGLPPPFTHADSLFGAPSDPGNAASQAWQPMLAEADAAKQLMYSAERRLLRQGLYAYRTSTLFHGCTAAQLRRFNLDDDLNSTWNVNTVEFCRLGAETSPDGAPRPESGLMYMRTRFPGLFCDREYVFARRVWHRVGDGGCYVVSVARPIDGSDGLCSHRTFRVTDYVSAFVVRDVQTDQGPAVELKSFYFEASGVPPLFSNMAVQKGLWGAVQDHARHFRAYVDALGCASGDDQGGAAYLQAHRDERERQSGKGVASAARRIAGFGRRLAPVAWMVSGMVIARAHGSLVRRGAR